MQQLVGGILCVCSEAGYPDDVATYALASSLLATTDPVG